MTITYELAAKRLEQFGTINSFKRWTKACDFTFIDGTISTKHSPWDILHNKWKSKPASRVFKHNYESASKVLKRLGTINAFISWQKPCIFTFKDGTVSTKHSPYRIEQSQWKSNPSRIKKHTFESASDRTKSFGKLNEFNGWEKSCKFTFIDGTVSDKHTPRDIERFGYKSKPKFVKTKIRGFGEDEYKMGLKQVKVQNRVMRKLQIAIN